MVNILSFPTAQSHIQHAKGCFHPRSPNRQLPCTSFPIQFRNVFIKSPQRLICARKIDSYHRNNHPLMLMTRRGSEGTRSRFEKAHIRGSDAAAYESAQFVFISWWHPLEKSGVSFMRACLAWRAEAPLLHKSKARTIDPSLHYAHPLIYDSVAPGRIYTSLFR